MANKRDELIIKYAAHLKEKFNQEPDMALLKKVAIGLGPSIYNRDSANVSGTDQKELATVKNNFLIKKLGLSEELPLEEAVNEIMVTYGISQRTKYRAVIYYMLTKKFGREKVYNN